VHHVQRELLESSLRSARAALELLGFDRAHARQLADDFRRHSEQFLATQRDQRNNEDDFVRRAREAREQFEQQMLRDLQRQTSRRSQAGWDANP
jgi:glutathione-regulated potassium-efflux system ancillary protein KefC